MKIQIEIDSSLSQDEIQIRCHQDSAFIHDLKQYLHQYAATKQKLICFQDTKEYHLPLQDILFFETDDKIVYAHTKKDMFETSYRLYELEAMLPSSFLRISKSAILNTDLVYSIQKSVTSTSSVSFLDTKKQVYISRHYYHMVKQYLKEKRLHV